MSKNIEAIIGYSIMNKPTAHKYTRLDDEEYEESELNYFCEDTPIEEYIANERKELHEMFKGTR